MKTRGTAAIIVLVIGIYLLLEGTYPTHGILMVGASIALGVAFVLSYFWLIGDHLGRWLRAPREITLMPVLLVLGLSMLGFALVKPGLASIELKLSFMIPGLVLALIAGRKLWKAWKRMQLKRKKIIDSENIPLV